MPGIIALLKPLELITIMNFAIWWGLQRKRTEVQQTRSDYKIF